MRAVRRGLLAVLVLGLAVVSPTVNANAASSSAELATFNRDLPDPFVLTTRDGYYAYGSTSQYGGWVLPILYSPDLRDWQEVGPALIRPPDWTDGAQIWAPSVVRTETNWRLVYSARSLRSGAHCLGLATATSPVGPFTDLGGPLRCSTEGFDMIDPEVFVDADTSAWLLWKTARAANDLTATIWSQRFDPVSGAFDGEPTALLTADQSWENPVIEAPSMARWDNGYSLFYSGGTFIDARYAVGYARCESPSGPCAKHAGPILRSGGNLVGPGGQAAFTDREGHLRLALHSWAPSPIGGIRALHLAAVLGTPAHPVVAGPTVGALDSARAIGRGVVSIEGWSFDTTGWEAATVVIDVDGRPTAATALDRGRADVDAVLGLTGARSFVGSVTLARGRHSVCARPPESGKPLGCRSVTIL